MEKEKLRYVEGHYRIENIAGLFMSGELNYKNYIGDKSLGFDLTRNFITSDTRLAGGISFSHNIQTMRENDFILMDSRYNLFNTWLGYAFPFHNF